MLLVLLLLAGCESSIKKEKKEEIIKFECFKTIFDGLSHISYEITGEYKNENLANVKSISIVNFEENGLDNYESFKSYLLTAGSQPPPNI